MIISFRSRTSVEELLLWGRWIALSGCVFVVLGFGLSRPNDVLSWKRGRSVGRELDVNQVLTGPLALKENTKSALALSMEKKLMLLAQSARPDLSKRDRSFCIGVKGGEGQKVVKEGESIFVNLTKHPSGGIESIEFAETGNMVMVPHVLDSHSLLLKIDAEGVEDEVFLHAGREGSMLNGLEEGVSSLEKAKWWGSDLFFKKYGGDQYGSMGQKQQIELIDGDRSYFLYLGVKDFLTFKDGQWKVIGSLEEAEREVPLAQVQGISQGTMEIEAWDVEGFVLFYAKLPLERISAMHISADEVILEPKLRSAKRVSCKLGKKHCLLRPGDWLIRKQNSWHKLKATDEIEAYLNHEMLGELFVVDAIDDEGILRLHFFDEMRMQMQPTEIKAASSKTKRKR